MLKSQDQRQRHRPSLLTSGQEGPMQVRSGVGQPPGEVGTFLLLQSPLEPTDSTLWFTFDCVRSQSSAEKRFRVGGVLD